MNASPIPEQATFLGSDGWLYRLEGIDKDNMAGFRRYFLGSDGQLYEAVEDD